MSNIIMRCNEKKELVSVDSREAEEVNLTGCDLIGVCSEAFKDMSKVKCLIVGEGIREIGEKACYDCPIEELELPRSLTKIGAQAFFGIRTKFVKYSGTIDDWFEVIRNSGFDIFGHNVILQCTDGELSFGVLDYAK